MNQDEHYFRVAVNCGGYQWTKKILEQGMDANSRDERGGTRLADAASAGNVELVKLLLEHGADVNAKDDDNWTALMRAARGECDESNLIEIINLFLERGADVNNQSIRGHTPLMWASQMGNHEVVKLLLKNGADVHAQTTQGWGLHPSWNALMFAADNGYKEIVETLLDHGADIHAKDRNGLTALEIAHKPHRVQCYVEPRKEVAAFLASQMNKTSKKQIADSMEQWTQRMAEDPEFQADLKEAVAKLRASGHEKLAKDYLEFSKKLMDLEPDIRRIPSAQSNFGKTPAATKPAEKKNIGD